MVLAPNYLSNWVDVPDFSYVVITLLQSLRYVTKFELLLVASTPFMLGSHQRMLLLS